VVFVDDARAQDRLAALEERVRLLEDQLAIERLINGWGPAVDTGNSGAAASLFTEDCILESDLSYLVTPAAIAAMVLGEGHQSLIRDGSAHIPASPIVNVEGDRATAIGYTRVYRHTPEGYEVWRVSANHWEFQRTPDGWRVSRRTNQVIDGSPKANELLSRVFDQ
jgi:ketosteroid isomerase-like protein